MRPVVYSSSSINAYTDCHLRWWFTYVALEEEKESEARAVGIAVHDYAERVLTGKHHPRPINPEVAALAKVFDLEVVPTFQNPVLIEAPFQIELDGIPFSGIIDAVDERVTLLEEAMVPMVIEGRDVIDDRSTYGKGYILRDLKTTASRPSAGKYRLNMTGYWLGATELGYPPDAAQLDYIVRTKKPYYWPEVMEPITDDDIDVLAATLTGVHNGVESGDYEPTGLGTRACSSCGYKAICGPYQRYQELTSPIREEAR